MPPLPDVAIGDTGTEMVNKLYDKFSDVDARFAAFIEPSGMPPAETPDGTELVGVSQVPEGEVDPIGVGMTVQQIAGNPVTAMFGHDRKTYEHFTAFNKIRWTNYTSANNGLLDQEPYIVRQSNGGKVVSGAPSVFGLDTSALLQTGNTDPAGAASIEHLGHPIPFLDSASDFESRALITLPTASTIQNDYIFRAGFNGSNGGVPIVGPGIFFEHRTSPVNWVVSVQISTGDRVEYDTGIPVVAGAATLISVKYDYRNLATNYYINGVLAYSMPNATKVLVNYTSLRAIFTLRKLVGLGLREAYISRHYVRCNFPGSVAEGF